MIYRKNEIVSEINRCAYKADEERSDLDKYKSVSATLAERQAERDELLRIKSKTPSLFKGKHKELDTRLYELGEEISELQHSKDAYVNRIKLNAPSVEAAERDVQYYDGKVTELKPKRDKCKAEITDKLSEYRKVEAESADIDQDKLTEARETIRPAKESEAIARIEKSGYTCYKDEFYEAKVEVAKLLGEEAPKPPEKKPIEPIVPPTPSWARKTNKKPPERKKNDWER